MSKHGIKASRTLGLLAALAASGVFAAGLSPEQLVNLARLSEPSVSPDGEYVVYTLRETDISADKGRTDLWRIAANGNAPAERMTRHKANDWSAQYSPDGRWLYFLSARGESPQVWRLSMAGGEPEVVTNYPVGVSGFKFSPNGRYLVLALTVTTDCNLDFECYASKSNATTKSSGVLYTQLFARHWDQWLGAFRSVLVSQALDKQGLPSRAPVELTRGIDADVPSRPFGGMEEVTVAPDSKTVVFAARLQSPDEAWSTNFDLYEVNIDGGRTDNLTASNPASDTAPLYGSDGALYWLAQSRPGYESDRYRIMRRTGNREAELAPLWDRSASAIFAGPAGKLYAIAADQGRRRVFEIDSKGIVVPVTAFGFASDLSVTDGGLYVVLNSLHKPADLYRIDATDNALYPLTDVNREALQEIQFGVYEQFQFAGWNDESVSGYIVKPSGASADKRYPVAFLIHGGPQGSFSDRFHYRWNAQTYAALGYAVIMIDFHGSTGYGQAFTDSIRGDWGGKPLTDLKLGLAHALETYDFLDGDRVCALGASYGGFMVNWIAGNWPERFNCLVNHDGVFDNRMMYYATEELWFPEWEHQGPHYKVPENYELHNPVNHVSAWQTPMLVIHGALDFRIPESQGIATFTALQRRGIESEFLFFPDENHWVMKPSNSVLWHHSVARWLDRYLRPETRR